MLGMVENEIYSVQDYKYQWLPIVVSKYQEAGKITVNTAANNGRFSGNVVFCSLWRIIAIDCG